MKQRKFIINGNKNGVSYSIHSKSFSSGADWWARIYMGLIEIGHNDAKEFAKKQLQKIDTLDFILVNGEVIKNRITSC